MPDTSSKTRPLTGALSARMTALEATVAEQRAIIEQMAEVVNTLTIRLRAVYEAQQVTQMTPSLVTGPGEFSQDEIKRVMG